MQRKSFSTLFHRCNRSKNIWVRMQKKSNIALPSSMGLGYWGFPADSLYLKDKKNIIPLYSVKISWQNIIPPYRVKISWQNIFPPYRVKISWQQLLNCKICEHISSFSPNLEPKLLSRYNFRCSKVIFCLIKCKWHVAFFYI